MTHLAGNTSDEFGQVCGGPSGVINKMGAGVSERSLESVQIGRRRSGGGLGQGRKVGTLAGRIVGRGKAPPGFIEISPMILAYGPLL